MNAAVQSVQIGTIVGRTVPVLTKKIGFDTQSGRSITTQFQSADRYSADLAIRSQLFVNVATSKIQAIEAPSHPIREEWMTRSGNKVSASRLVNDLSHVIHISLTRPEKRTFPEASVKSLFNLISGILVMKSDETARPDKNNRTKAERLERKFYEPGHGYDKFFKGNVLFSENEFGDEVHIRYATATLNVIYAQSGSADQQRLREFKDAIVSVYSPKPGRVISKDDFESVPSSTASFSDSRNITMASIRRRGERSQTMPVLNGSITLT